MIFNEAQKIAEDIKTRLEPSCERVEIAGSIRRKKPEVKDIEIVCIPKDMPVSTGLFGETDFYRDTGFIETIKDMGAILSGDPVAGKYIKIALNEGINLDLFIANPFNWGYIFLIRTGPEHYSHEMAKRWCWKKYHGKDGNLYRDGEKDPIELREESDLYNLLQMPFVQPEERHLVFPAK